MAPLSKLFVSALCLVSVTTASAIPRSTTNDHVQPRPHGNHTLPAPGGNVTIHTPGGDVLSPVPGNGTVHAPGGNVTIHVPGGNHTLPVPGGNHTLPVPGGNHTIPVPGGNHTIPVPGGNHTAPAPGGNHPPWGNHTAPAPGDHETGPTTPGDHQTEPTTPGDHQTEPSTPSDHQTPPVPGTSTETPCEEHDEVHDENTPGVPPLADNEGLLLASQYYNVFPQRPYISGPPSDGLHLESYHNLTQRETVAVFRDIPAEATLCTFGFFAGSPDDRIFVSKITTTEGVSTDALSIARQLSGFPAQGTPVSYDTISDFDTEPTEQSPELRSRVDFNNWDDPDFESVVLTANWGAMRCEETMYIKLSLVDPRADKHVYHQAKEVEGLFIKYTI